MLCVNFILDRPFSWVARSEHILFNFFLNNQIPISPTFELMTLFVNLVPKTSALWFISHIHENASLEKENKFTYETGKCNKLVWIILHSFINRSCFHSHKACCFPRNFISSHLSAATLCTKQKVSKTECEWVQVAAKHQLTFSPHPHPLFLQLWNPKHPKGF